MVDTATVLAGVVWPNEVMVSALPAVLPGDIAVDVPGGAVVGGSVKANDVGGCDGAGLCDAHRHVAGHRLDESWTRRAAELGRAVWIRDSRAYSRHL